MRFDTISIFPQMFEGALSQSIIKRSKETGVLEFKFWNPRDYSEDKHNNVDDVPFGGGGGMLMTCQPLFDCIEAVKKENKGPVVYLSATGELWNQELCEKYADKYAQLILLCGHYEGIDQRVIDELVDIIAEIAGKKIIKKHDLSKPQGVRGRNSDNTKLKEVLRWVPQIRLEDGLKQTYKWIEEQVKEL